VNTPSLMAARALRLAFEVAVVLRAQT